MVRYTKEDLCSGVILSKASQSRKIGGIHILYRVVSLLNYSNREKLLMSVLKDFHFSISDTEDYIL